jgi:hypothetical protein
MRPQSSAFGNMQAGDVEARLRDLLTHLRHEGHPGSMRNAGFYYVTRKAAIILSWLKFLYTNSS